jgi:hypothetical protein
LSKSSRTRHRVAAIAVGALVATALGAGLAGGAFAAQQARCGVDAKLDGDGRAKATSTCTVIQGPKVGNTRTVNQHRAVINCDNIRGQGNQHDIRNTQYGPWEKPGTASSAKCAIRSSLAGFSQDIK